MGSSCGFVEVCHHVLFLLRLGFILLLVERGVAGTLGWVSATGLLCQVRLQNGKWNFLNPLAGCWRASVLGLRQSVRFPGEGQQCVRRQGCV